MQFRVYNFYEMFLKNIANNDIIIMRLILDIVNNFRIKFNNVKN